MSARCAMHHEEVKFVEFMLFEEEVDDGPDDDIETRFGVQPAQQIRESGGRCLDVPLGECDQQRVLVREVLIERTHRDLGLVGDVVRSGPAISLLVENASRRIEDALDRAAGPLLEWRFTGGEG